MPTADAGKILAIDIGSTRVHMGIVDQARRRCLKRADFPRDQAEELLPPICKTLRLGPGSFPVVIAGGRDGLATRVEEILAGHGVSPGILQWSGALPINFHYSNPELLGADRIAHALFAADAYPGQDAIIISAGTAITVDLVTAEREFAGGVILPGAQVQLQSLHASTILPQVSMGGPRDLPATSTASCMRAGVFHGIAAALSHFVKQYQSQRKGPWVVLATGGGWQAISELVDFEAECIRNMTLIGIGIYAGAVGKL